MTPMEQVRAKCQEVVALAQRLYNVDLSVVRISFDLKGRAAGRAEWRGNRLSRERTYAVRFNHDMIVRGDAEALRDMVEDTVPHEFAHIVCFMNPALGDNHNPGWARVCRMLGGSGSRTHDTEVVYGKGNTYEYTTDRGHKVRLSDQRHRAVQSGGILRYRKGLGTITNHCAYSIVGVGGRSLAQPIVKKAVATIPTAPNTPAAIESAMREVRAVPPVAPAVRPNPFLIPAAQPVAAPVQRATPGESKAATSRRIMLSGYRAGNTYEQIINAMIAANGYDRQLARATFKANQSKCGIPSTWGG